MNGHSYRAGEPLPSLTDLPRLSYAAVQPSGPLPVRRVVQLTTKKRVVDSTCSEVRARWAAFVAAQERETGSYAVVLNDPKVPAGYVVELDE